MKMNRVAATPIRNIQREKSPSFGHVIPVKIRLNGKFLNPAKANEDFYKSVIMSFANRIGKKENDLFKKLAENFSKIDSDFDGTLRSIRSKYHKVWGIRRYFVTGSDKNWQNKIGHEIGYYAENDKNLGRQRYRESEHNLTQDPTKRIKEVACYIIDVITKPITKKDGTQGGLKKIITGGEFEMDKPKQLPAPEPKKIITDPKNPKQLMLDL